MKIIEALTSGYVMFSFTGQDKDQVCFGEPLVMSKPDLKQGFSIQAGYLYIPNHRHSHYDVGVTMLNLLSCVSGMMQTRRGLVIAVPSGPKLRWCLP